MGLLLVGQRFIIYGSIWNALHYVSPIFGRLLVVAAHILTSLLLRMIRQEHTLSKMTAVWLLPIITLIVISSSGGNIALSMRSHSHTMAIVTAAFSFTMVVLLSYR
jgi:tellurite resistance protein TehA-like permease